jgi:large subunit ribosomal protein L23
MNAYDILKRPVTTEKSDRQQDNNNQVTFEVDCRANRIEIARAVESIFNVRIEDVKTMRVKGKIKRRGRTLGRRRDWKKAIVTLAPGQRIAFFDGV